MHMQTELEERVENLAEIVVRPNLRTPRNRIVYTTRLAKRKRSDFLRALENGLIPPDTSPSLWKRRHHFIEVFQTLPFPFFRFIAVHCIEFPLPFPFRLVPPTGYSLLSYAL